MPLAGLPKLGLIKKHSAKHWHYQEELLKRCSSSKLLEQLKMFISCRFNVEYVVCLFICTLWTVCTYCYQLWKFSLDLSQPITGSLASPSVLGSLCKRLLCTKRLLASCNQLASDWSWSHLNIGPALWLEVGPLWKTRGTLQYKIIPGCIPYGWLLN